MSYGDITPGTDQRYSHGPIRVEPYICRVGDYDMFAYRDVMGSQVPDVIHPIDEDRFYIVLRYGNASGRYYLGFLLPANGYWCLNEDATENHRDSGRIESHALMDLMDEAIVELNKHLKLKVDTDGVGDAMERLA